jgi:hypothetical protein
MANIINLLINNKYLLIIVFILIKKTPTFLLEFKFDMGIVLYCGRYNFDLMNAYSIILISMK